MERITTVEALRKGNRTFRTLYAKTAMQANVLAISHILHVAEHGDNSTLNEFSAILSSNDGTALTLYISRLHAIIGGWDGTTSLPAEEMSAFKAKGAFLKRKDKGYTVIADSDTDETTGRDPKANKLAALALAEEMLNPDGERFTGVFERNNLSEIKTMGDTELQRAVAKLIKSAKGENTKIKSAVTPANLTALLAAQAVIGKPPTKDIVLQ